MSQTSHYLVHKMWVHACEKHVTVARFKQVEHLKEVPTASEEHKLLGTMYSDVGMLF